MIYGDVTMAKHGKYDDYEIDVVLNIGIALSKEKDRRKLLNMILNKSMEITNCDAGTLYLVNDNALHFQIMKTISQNVDNGQDGSKINLPPVPIRKENVCGYTAIYKEPMNIADVYYDDTFDFSGPKNYDKMTGYRTQSMLSVPLVNQEDEVVGVIQLINSQDKDGNTIPFKKELENIIFALSAQTAIAVSNMKYIAEMKEQMWSFTEAMSEAIDNRTPYNANHVRKVAEYTERLADYMNELHKNGEEDEYFNENRKEKLVMAAYLHDIGKMIIPTKIMNKPSRLGDKVKELTDRLNIIKLRYKIDWLEGRVEEEFYQEKSSEIDRINELIDKMDYAGFVEEQTMNEMKGYFDKIYEAREENIAYFTEEEKECLSIQKGTLTDEERKIMQSHVEMTEKILEKVHFNSYYKGCDKWAVQHHEFLNGKGYPRHLTAKDLPIESRIIAVADICDALLSVDRPYKKPMPKEKAFAILKDMAAAGNIDGKLVDYMEKCI